MIAILTAFLVIIGIYLILSIIVFPIFEIIGLWKMFSKAGEEGWKSIIPIYNLYTLCVIIGVSPYWILFVVCSVFIPIIGGLLSFASVLYFSVLVAGSTARTYGKSDGFAFGLFFLPQMFHFIIGVGASEYQGPNPMEDSIGDWFFGLFGKSNTSFTKPGDFENRSYSYSNYSNPTNSTNQTKQTDQTNQANSFHEVEILDEQVINFCKYCGTKVEPEERFCVNCGKKLN